MKKSAHNTTHQSTIDSPTNGIEDFSGNNDVSIRPASSFMDCDWWSELFDLHLGRYPKPGDLDQCTEESMSRWMDRLEMAPLSDTPLEDFVTLNPSWPLMAWLGTMLEIKHEGGL